jgi:hypothetical protein
MPISEKKPSLHRNIMIRPTRQGLRDQHQPAWSATMMDPDRRARPLPRVRLVRTGSARAPA